MSYWVSTKVPYQTQPSNLGPRKLSRIANAWEEGMNRKTKKKASDGKEKRTGVVWDSMFAEWQGHRHRKYGSSRNACWFCFVPVRAMKINFCLGFSVSMII